MRRTGVACLILLVSSVAALGDDVEDCDQSGDCKRRLSGCSALIESGTANGEKLADLYLKRGQAELCLGGADGQARAMADYSKAIDIEPRFAKAYLSRGSEYTNQAKYVEAIADFNKAVDLDPNDDAAILYRGLAFFASGQNDNAIADLDKAVALKPDDIVNYLRRGEVLFTMGQQERALGDFTKAIELSPTSETYGMRAYYYRQLGQYERAIADYDKMIELLPKCESCYFNRGVAYEKAGDKQRAIADFRQSLTLKESYQPARAALERLGEVP